MTDRLVAAPAAHPAAVRDGLRAVIEERAGAVDRPLAVLDIGGGTGGFAVPLAQVGDVITAVTVVDPSPDSLPALHRRAADAGVAGRITARRGDAAGVAGVAGPAGRDVVVCPSAPQVVDDPMVALAAPRGVLRPGELLSVLVVTRSLAVLGRVLAGRLAEALALLDDRSGPGDRPRRRFAPARLAVLPSAAGLQRVSLPGVRAFADLVPGGLRDVDPHLAALLATLAARVADDAGYRALAGQLHALAAAPAAGPVAAGEPVSR